MTVPVASRESVAEALRSIGLTDEPESYDDGIHSWRCSHPDIYGRCTCFTEAVTDILNAVDWRVLGGLVPGVINAAWLRDGDRVRLNKLEGTVLLHRIINVDHVGRLVRFLVQTDIGGHVQYDRALDAEILVLTPAGVDRG